MLKLGLNRSINLTVVNSFESFEKLVGRWLRNPQSFTLSSAPKNLPSESNAFKSRECLAGCSENDRCLFFHNNIPPICNME